VSIKGALIGFDPDSRYSREQVAQAFLYLPDAVDAGISHASVFTSMQIDLQKTGKVVEV